MNAALLAKATQKQQKQNAPQLRAGDVVRVHQRIKEGSKERIQIFEGIVIRVRGGRGLDGSFTVRRIASGTGIERTFPLHLPSITKVEKIRQIRLRQARPYYLRTLTQRQIARRTHGALSEFISWEEKGAAEAEEEIKAAQEAEAKAREDAETQAEADADAKVAAAEARHQEADAEKAEDSNPAQDK